MKTGGWSQPNRHEEKNTFHEIPVKSPIQKSDLPFGSEFSPSQIELIEVLRYAAEYGGNWKAFEERIRIRYFESYQTTEKNRKKLANNCKLGMIAYGIIDRDANLSVFGKRLFELSKQKKELYEELARHILLNLNGVNLIQCILDIQASGGQVTLLKLRTWLEERGIHFPAGGKHPSIMRLWLEKAGIFKSGWNVDEKLIENILGVSTNAIDTLAAFSPEQKAYLKALANMSEGKSHQSNQIQKMAAAIYGVRFDEKNLPKQVLYPLQHAGYIELSRGTKSPGRGAKPFFVTAATKLKKELIEPVLTQLEKQLHSELRPLLRKDLSEIVSELDTTDKYRSGLMLEALAFKIMRLLDMKYITTRLRGTATGGAEVDLIVESTRLVFSRWQIQCKNTKMVRLDDIAKEVGLTHVLKSNVIVVITTGSIGKEARLYANRIMADSNINIVMVDRKDTHDIIQKPSSIIDIFHREAEATMKLKALRISNG